MDAEQLQLDLFDDCDTDQSAVLNGMYYEATTGLFVSFVLGRRHWEGKPAADWSKQWQEKTKRERAIND